MAPRVKQRLGGLFMTVLGAGGAGWQWYLALNEGYFYPKANTSGCTHEAIGFRDALKGFQGANTAIVGCSGDSVEAQAKFKAKYKLNFPLLADMEFEVVEAYGARRMKSFFGKSFLGIVRATFWIGPDGKIRKVWPKVAVKGHAADVLAAVKQG